MVTSHDEPVTAAIDPATHVGAVALSVADLGRSLRYYTRALGLAVLRGEGGQVVLGVGETPLLLLNERPGALPWMIDRLTGLYHFALLVPTRADLGRWLRHYLATDYPPPGQGDHVVSEALYLRDPDGHGIEVYADRPRATWQWENGHVRMGAGPVDVRGLLAQGGQRPFDGLAAGTVMGHVHLQVGDIAQAERFYHGVLGFDVVASMGEALFVSAGGYHHHLGLNTWHSRGAAPAPADTAALRFFTLALPSTGALQALRGRLSAAGVAQQAVGDAVAVADPWENCVLLHVGNLPGAGSLTALDAALARPAG